MTETIVTRSIDILLVDDCDLYFDLLDAVMTDWGLDHQMHYSANATDALAYLHHEGEYSDAPRPDLILLDLTMPGIDGHELLGRIKRDRELRAIPVVILSTSSDQEDIRRAYSRFANGYLTKPFEVLDLKNSLGAMHSFWFDIVTSARDAHDVFIDRAQVSHIDPHTCPLRILYIEDNPLDAAALVNAAQRLGFPREVQCVDTGDIALRLLRCEPPWENAARPDLILLDMHLPGKSGLEVLREIRATEDADHRYQIIGFTSDTSRETVEAAYHGFVTAVIQKPRTEDDLTRTLSAIAHWSNVMERVGPRD